jgi:hypothetical protein
VRGLRDGPYVVFRYLKYYSTEIFHNNTTEDVKERFDFEKIYTDFESYDDVEAFGSKTKIE